VPEANFEAPEDLHSADSSRARHTGILQIIREIVSFGASSKGICMLK
jgi:hypothetical protein